MLTARGVHSAWNEAVWSQFGAAIDMLERAIVACPETLWNDRERRPEFWALAYHTLFWLDCYLADAPDAYAPPAPFTLDEGDPDASPPARPYTQAELATYLAHGRHRCREVLAALTAEQASARCAVARLELTVAELLLYNLRHVQHGAAQLNLLLRLSTGSAAPGWLARGLH